MAKKLGAIEFLDRHLLEADAIYSLFKSEHELRYSEIRKKLSLDRRSREERKFQRTDSEQRDLKIKHETQLMRILTAFCDAGVMTKITQAKKVYYHINLEKSVAEEIKLRSRIAGDPYFFRGVMEEKERLLKELESCKTRIYDLNLEIGSYIRENIELKKQLAQIQSLM